MEASRRMETSPPSHAGSEELMLAPNMASSRLKTSVPASDCSRIIRAPFRSPAPTLWATCTENPVAAAVQSPQKSHVVVDTSPMEADASAPIRPTMAASIYCMMMEDSCAIMAGTLSSTVRRSCCRKVIGRPSRIRSSNTSVFFFAAGCSLDCSGKAPFVSVSGKLRFIGSFFCC